MGAEAGTSTVQRTTTVTLTPRVLAVASPADAEKGVTAVDSTTRSDEPNKLSVRTSNPPRRKRNAASPAQNPQVLAARCPSSTDLSAAEAIRGATSGE